MNTEKIIEKYKVEKLLRFVQNYPNDHRIQVAGHQLIDGVDICFYAAILSKECVHTAIEEAAWDIRIGKGFPYIEESSEKAVKYIPSGNRDIVPLCYWQEFPNDKTQWVPLQDFVLLNNLFFDHVKNAYIHLDEDLNPTEVISIEDDNVFILSEYLHRYISARQMYLALYFDGLPADTDDFVSYEDFYQVHECQPFAGPQDHLFYNFHYSENSKGKRFVSILGKHLISPEKIEKCGYEPFDDPEEEFEEFIIGHTRIGEKIISTCDPGQLNDLFVHNKKYNYLQPVFFDHSVLKKYYDKPELYSVTDTYIEKKGCWLIRYNQSDTKGIISLYLGDLGRDLPYSEQKYWRHYNRYADASICETGKRRDLLGEWVETTDTVTVFKEEYEKLQALWFQKFNWYLFRPLPKQNLYCYETLHLPVTESRDEFNQMILSIAKITIDSVDEGKINNLIKDEIAANEDGKKIAGSINRLEILFKKYNLPDYESHVSFFRKVQDIRSTGAAHSGNEKNYSKAAEKIGLTDNNYYEVIKDILERFQTFFQWLESHIDDIQGVQEADNNTEARASK